MNLRHNADLSDPSYCNDLSNPLIKHGEKGKRQEIEWGLLTGCVYIIIVSTENKPLSTTTKLLISDTWVCV